MPNRDEPTSDSPGPDPSVTTSLESGAGVQPGDTPPAADSMSGAAPSVRRDSTPNMGPVVGNRTPMFITLFFIGLITLLVVGYGVAEITAYLREQPGDEQQSIVGTFLSVARG